MIYGEELEELSEVGTVERQQNIAGHMAFIGSATSAGVYRSGEELSPSTSATTLRLRNGNSLITDGPFAESKEQLGGFYLLDCKNLDEALELAAKIPEATRGAIEIRPIVEH